MTRVVRTSQSGIDLAEDTAWPLATAGDGRAVDFSRVHTGLAWAAKLYAEAPESVAAVAPDGARLSLDWERDFAPVLGIWLAYGGWPVDGDPCEQVALEPTTSAHDDLAAARADGRERVLAPGAKVTWVGGQAAPVMMQCQRPDSAARPACLPRRPGPSRQAMTTRCCDGSGSNE